MKSVPSRLRPRRRSLVPVLSALTIATAAAMVAGNANAATVVVGNCNDNGSGSLRNAVANALTGDTIDLRSLSCSRITLTGGQIPIPQANLNLIGRSRYALTIDGNRNGRVLSHTGTGTLRIERISITNGYQAVPDELLDEGGCIRSVGNVELHRARVHHCAVHKSGFLESGTTGGGIHAHGNVLVSFSAVFSNSATENGYGGGVLAGGRVTLYRSQVYNNYGYVGGGVVGRNGVTATYSLIHGNRANSLGGGIYVEGGDLTVNKSTISNNVVNDVVARAGPFSAGGGLAVGGPPGGRRLIIDSTISGNAAWFHSAAYIGGDVDIYNSTIAFNVEFEGIDPDFPTMPCENRGALTANVLHLESTIVAKNTCTIGPASYDIAGSASAIIGADNLIGRSRIPVPPDTISADPRLAPLAEYGGPTRTHLLLSDSPAINRGPGFPRLKGAATDIGATER